MPNNRKVYIIGHKNPDTDSICSAIAYADIKNRTDKSRVYAARRAGSINGETDYVLKRFGVEEPPFVPDVGTQVQDMDIHKTEGVSGNISLKRAWYMMKDQNAVTLPITDDEQHLEGLITIGDIAKSYMDAYDNTILAKSKTQYESIAETLDGKVLVGNPQEYYVEGKVLIGAVHPDMLGHYISKGDMVILGNLGGRSSVCPGDGCKMSDRLSGLPGLSSDYPLCAGEGMCDYHHAVRYVYGGQADQSEYTG